MDKLQKHFPIRNRKVKHPIVFTFNILMSHFLAYKQSHYLAIQKIIQHYNKVDNFYLLPNITNVSMTIEERGA